MVVPIIFLSDATHPTNFSGDKNAWPVYMMIGNLSTIVRMPSSQHAILLIALLPIPNKLHDVPISQYTAQKENNRVTVAVLQGTRVSSSDASESRSGSGSGSGLETGTKTITEREQERERKRKRKRKRERETETDSVRQTCQTERRTASDGHVEQRRTTSDGRVGQKDGQRQRDVSNREMDSIRQTCRTRKDNVRPTCRTKTGGAGRASLIRRYGGNRGSEEMEEMEETEKTETRLIFRIEYKRLHD